MEVKTTNGKVGFCVINAQPITAALMAVLMRDTRGGSGDVEGSCRHDLSALLQWQSEDAFRFTAAVFIIIFPFFSYSNILFGFFMHTGWARPVISWFIYHYNPH